MFTIWSFLRFRFFENFVSHVNYTFFQADRFAVFQSQDGLLGDSSVEFCLLRSKNCLLLSRFVFCLPFLCLFFQCVRRKCFLLLPVLLFKFSVWFLCFIFLFDLLWFVFMFVCMSDLLLFLPGICRYVFYVFVWVWVSLVILKKYNFPSFT